ADVAPAAGDVEAPQNIKLKDRKDWRLIGTPQKRLDVLAKVQGKTTYGIDVRVPDMVYAAVLQAPVFKAKLKAVDDSKIAGRKGVRKLIKLDHAVAVIADTWWGATP